MSKKIQLYSMALLLLVLASCAQILNPRPGGGGPRQGGGGNPRNNGNQGEGNGGGIGNFDVSTYTGQVIRDITYARGVKTYQGTVEDLQMDIYMPENPSPGKKYPLMLFAHGGGFLVGDKKTSKGYCAGFATNGFVTATINYRLGWEKDRSVLCSGDSMQMKQALYRAVQDARAALRFLVHNAADYAIDTSWIFIAGPSAGGAISMQTTYLTQTSAERFLPGVASYLGTLDNSGNDLKDKFTIKGTVNMWGGIGDISMITAQNAVPCISFHGMKDLVSPYDYGYMYTCNLFMKIYGSKPIYNHLNSLGVPTVAHIDPAGGHGVYTQIFNIDNIVCFFKDYMAKKKITSKYLTTEVKSCN
jgi:poly(3-hydroxybutyrate) depolymerase